MVMMVSQMDCQIVHSVKVNGVMNVDQFQRDKLMSEELEDIQLKTSEDQIMTAVEGMTGVYKYTSTYVTATDDADELWCCRSDGINAGISGEKN